MHFARTSCCRENSDNRLFADCPAHLSAHLHLPPFERPRHIIPLHRLTKETAPGCRTSARSGCIEWISRIEQKIPLDWNRAAGEDFRRCYAPGWAAQGSMTKYPAVSACGTPPANAGRSRDAGFARYGPDILKGKRPQVRCCCTLVGVWFLENYLFYRSGYR